MESTTGNQNRAMISRKAPFLSQSPKLSDYDSSTNNIIHGATDSMWASDRKHRRSTGGILCMRAGGAVYYRTRLQPKVALSSSEAELASIVEAGKATPYLRSIL